MLEAILAIRRPKQVKKLGVARGREELALVEKDLEKWGKQKSQKGQKEAGIIKMPTLAIEDPKKEKEIKKLVPAITLLFF